MQLVSLTIARGGHVVRHIPFKQGLNLILDKPATAGSTDSGNNVGKTTVLRLIDYCLGSDGDDIWKDAEFKDNKNQEVYDFLHGSPSVHITLEVSDPLAGLHSLRRTFKAREQKTAVPLFQIDEVVYDSITAYRDAVKNILFGTSAQKPTLRQLAPKFVRTDNGLDKTLRFLHASTSDADYEALHLFLFGFFNVGVLEQRAVLTRNRKVVARDLIGATRQRKEGAIKQLLLHLRAEVEEAQTALRLRGEVPDIAQAANDVSELRTRASLVAAHLGRLEGERASLNLAIASLRQDYDNVDFVAVKSIYSEAGKYNDVLQHDWEDLSNFVTSLRGRKERFLHKQLDELTAKAAEAQQMLATLQVQEEQVVSALQQSRAFEVALEERADLHEKLKQIGGLEESLQTIQALRTQLNEIDVRLLETRRAIEDGMALLDQRVGQFNEFFSALSKELYGEQYLLTFDDKKGTIIFSLTAVGANVGEGKKASQTAAFDIAYIKFLRKAGIHFPTFVCHDGVEAIHGNQLEELLNTANEMDGQLILAAIRDKLPEMGPAFFEENTVVALSQDDKLFGL